MQIYFIGFIAFLAGNIVSSYKDGKLQASPVMDITTSVIASLLWPFSVAMLAIKALRK